MSSFIKMFKEIYENVSKKSYLLTIPTLMYHFNTSRKQIEEWINLIED